jgi:hypothetical protein
MIYPKMMRSIYVRHKALASNAPLQPPCAKSIQPSDLLRKREKHAIAGRLQAIVGLCGRFNQALCQPQAPLLLLAHPREETFRHTSKPPMCFSLPETSLLHNQGH